MFNLNDLDQIQKIDANLPAFFRGQSSCQKKNFNLIFSPAALMENMIMDLGGLN